PWSTIATSAMDGGSHASQAPALLRDCNADQARIDGRRLDAENRHGAVDDFCRGPRSRSRRSLFCAVADCVLIRSLVQKHVGAAGAGVAVRRVVLDTEAVRVPRTAE